jgi:hypothetical protein
MPLSSTPIVIIGAILGAIAGANVASMIQAKRSMPSRAVIQK